MTEIPEHLRKRAEAARQRRRPRRASAAAADARGGAPRRRRTPAESRDPRPPPRAQPGRQGQGRRRRGRRGRRRWRRGGGRAAVRGDRGRRPRRPAACPSAPGPGGHTQRLLTVVKSGSIQDVKATPRRQGPHVAPPAGRSSSWPRWPARRSCFVFSVFVNAPLLRAGEPQPDAEPVEGAVVLPRPAGAPDHVPPDGGRGDHPGHGPDPAGLAPYMDRNPSNKPEDRKFAIASSPSS